MRKETWALSLLFALAVALLGVVPAQASTPISSCPYTITTSGTYVVTQDLTCAATAITVLASKVNLHLAGHTISETGGGDGILVQGRQHRAHHLGLRGER